RFLQRGIPKNSIREILARGIVIPDPKNIQRKICIYKNADHRYYSIVFEEVGEVIFIVTGYNSDNLEIKYYNKVKSE
ncbi:hypothetical protein KJ660_03420, partial [Candidatus Micrarchaeota archaeon]|nr:hypothetical protein [Candidatus Micrarchaeota archaeon]